jgi:hypothetical protein
MPQAVSGAATAALVFLVVSFGYETSLAAPLQLYLFNLNTDQDYQVRVDGADHASA